MFLNVLVSYAVMCAKICSIEQRRGRKQKQFRIAATAKKVNIEEWWQSVLNNSGNS